MAPEALKFNRYSYKSDVWSFGIIAFEMVFGYVPWRDPDDDQLLAKVTTTTIDSVMNENNTVRLSNDFKTFIRRCVDVDAKNRATPEEIINFNWPLATDYIPGAE